MKKPTLLLAVLPFIVLIFTMFAGVRLFGDSVTAGPSQIALLFATTLTSGIAMLYLKIPWKKLEEGMLEHLSKTGSAIFILLMIGALTGSWMISGIVPSMIYYSLKLIHPSIFLLVTLIITSVISVMIGSSWTTIGTIGVALLTAGQIMGYSSPWLAGAIISGAYFGDKLSPLSDTTNLASSVAGVDLYVHVRYMMITIVPTITLAAVIFTVSGLFMDITPAFNIEMHTKSLTDTFVISPLFLLVPALTIIMIIKKVSPFITLFISALIGALVAVIFQPQLCAQISPDTTNAIVTGFKASIKMLSSTVSLNTGDQMLDSLLATRGMAGMLNTVWLILCVVTFGGVLHASGMIQVITEKLVSMVKSTVGLVGSTVSMCIAMNLTLSDQYMSILIPGKMFADTYRKKGYQPQLLSRTLEDSGTVTSVLVPWNTCGIVQSSVLQVATLTYLPYTFFNLLTPVVTLTVAAIGYKIKRTTQV